jgi:hypothetical protein
MAALLSPLACRVGVPAAAKLTQKQHVRRGGVKVAASAAPSSAVGGGSWGGASRGGGRVCISRRKLVSQQQRRAPEEERIVPSSSAGDASAADLSSGDSSSAAASGGPSGGGGSPNFIASFVRGLRLRMAADANFPFKLGAEVCLDEVMTVAVNIGVRGNPVEWLLGAKLQVICQMLTAAVNDIILVYCLAPVKQEEGVEAAPKEEIAHIFQEGDFSLGQRFGCYVSKGAFYAFIGAISCTFSMALALSLSGQTAQLTPEYLFRACMCGALHMGISANTRYQIVNGVERVLYSVLPQGAARIASILARLSNNLLGARLWIVMTTLTGLA